MKEQKSKARNNSKMKKTKERNKARETLRSHQKLYISSNTSPGES